MTKQISLSKLSDKELQKLQNDVGKAITERAATKRNEALAAAMAEAKKHGFSLQDLVGGSKGRKTKAPSPPKYKHPENPEVTWTGRGRQPAWIKDALARGEALEKFAI